MHTKWSRVVAILLLPAFLVLSFPPACHAGDFSDNSSEGAAITIGLFVAILTVLFLVSFKSDVDNVLSKNQKQELLKQKDSLVQDISLVLEPPRPCPAQFNMDADSEFELASGLNVGVRVQF